MASSTKIYENTTGKPILLRELGETIAPHDRISITTEYHTPLNLINYPGVIDVLEAEANGATITQIPVETVDQTVEGQSK